MLARVCWVWILNSLVFGEESYIELFTDSDYGGTKLVLNESAGLLTGGFNDQVSSFKVGILQESTPFNSWGFLFG